MKNNHSSLRAQSKTASLIKLIVAAVILIVLIVMPFVGGAYIRNILILIFLYMAVSQMWNLLAGYTGLVSLGMQAFIGLAGYVLALTTQQYGKPIWLAFILAAVIAVVFALIISLPIFKMKGVYFTIGTWIIAEALYVFFANWAFVKYSIGYNITVAYRMNLNTFYYLCLVIGIVSIAVVLFILRSKTGLALMAMRDNEDAAEVRGVRLYRTKLMCFLIASVVTAIAGVALYLNLAYIRPTNAFSIEWTVSMVFIVIIGGIGTIEGPIIGAIIYVLLSQILYNFAGYSNLILGIIAVILIMVAPKGIMGYLEERFAWDIFGIRRRIKPKS
ncbi:MAG: branched-chain amino acid ABC transporter permease [Oscillospiraceae bacterium]|nr:branched-chain amino acid ABC transporter permease [Oscillospiraceae bacterium]